MTLDQLYARDDLVGTPVVVEGLLDSGEGSSTIVACAPPACCNRVGAGFELRDRQPRYRLQLRGRDPGCGGDESLVCCNREARGQQVVVRGILRRRGQAHRTLDDAEVCVSACAGEAADHSTTCDKLVRQLQTEPLDGKDFHPDDRRDP